jgi:CRISPR/Cas system type I-B associated protein Csh2 (Cas7 group RAMP superfamily)
METLNKKIDSAIVLNVKNANPRKEVSDICIKIKIRNRLLNLGENIIILNLKN